MNRFIWPLLGFILLTAFLAVGLFLDPREVPSPLIDKPAPDFTLPVLVRTNAPTPDGDSFSPAKMRGKVWMLNIWASWCFSCRAEHPLLVEFAASKSYPVIGLNYKEVRGDGSIDVPEDENAEMQLASKRANAWLDYRGDPYLLTVMDNDGRAGINYGVYGVPETYLIDKAGIIRFKQIGQLTEDVMQRKILPLAAKLAEE